MDIVLFVLGAVLLVLLWIALHDTTHFEKTEYLVTDPRIQKPFRAVVLSDLHNRQYGRGNSVLIDAIREGTPDLVLIAGDILTAKPGKDSKVARHLIEVLSKEYPICYGMGNHEHRLALYQKIYGDMGEKYEDALKEMGVTLMHNETRCFEELGVEVVGSQIHHRYYRRRRKRPMRDTYLESVLGEPDDSKYTILLAHNPDYFPEYAKWGADLVLSGHLHGGAIRVPFWNKGILSPAVKFFPKYDGGLFEEGSSSMILSRGLGCHTIPLRLFNPGDLIFLDFQPGKKRKIEQKGNLKQRKTSSLEKEL